MALRSRARRQPLLGRTAVICGASEGIGKETARRIAGLGGSVCLVARRPEPLAAAAREVEAAARGDGVFVDTLACDATDADRFGPMLDDFVARRGVPEYLVNAVGYAHAGYVQELGLEDYRRSMDVNYYGQLVPTLALLPHFMAARKGHIAFVSSMMGYFGIMGYAAYAPTKFALVGLAEALRSELKPYGIRVSVLYPPDTETPGLEAESRTRPPENARMAAGAGLLGADEVARVFVDGLIRGKYTILPGEAGLAWRVHRFLPGVLRWVTDRMYARARRELGKDPAAG